MSYQSYLDFLKYIVLYVSLRSQGVYFDNPPTNFRLISDNRINTQRVKDTTQNARVGSFILFYFHRPILSIRTKTNKETDKVIPEYEYMKHLLELPVTD